VLLVVLAEHCVGATPNVAIHTIYCKNLRIYCNFTIT